jgi:hypothetical protein
MLIIESMETFSHKKSAIQLHFPSFQQAFSFLFLVRAVSMTEKTTIFCQNCANIFKELNLTSSRFLAILIYSQCTQQNIFVL